MKNVLKLIAAEMKAAGIEYHFEVNKKSPPTYPYHVGELFPAIPTTEDGMQEYTLELNGFNRKTESSDGTLSELLADVQKIEEHFPLVDGFTTLIGNQAVMIHYISCTPVTSGDEQVQKVQTTLSIKTWKG